jgi:hypothetical protein
MPPAVSSTEVFAFSAPKIKGGEVEFAINLGAGSLHVLRGTPSVWRGLTAHLLALYPDLAPVARQPGEVRTGYVRSRRDGRVLKPEVRAQYVRAWSEWKRGLAPSLAGACRAHALPYFSVQRWCIDNADTLPAEAAALTGKAPIPKPSGRLL